jgi:epoxyqueuosine reductase
MTAPIRSFLAGEGAKAGFATFGIAPAKADAETAQRLKDFIAKGHHGSMDWMEQTLERRLSPDAMWPSAKSALVFAMNYGPEADPLLALENKNRAAISVYAQNRDYHDVVKGRLKEIAGRFAAKYGAEVKVFVDTAPLMEKPLAAKAGLGWQGKHTNLVSRNHGSWLFLGTILTSLALTPDTADGDHCGTCRACLDVCPTAAFPAPYQLDARRCISYLTIEHKEPIERQFRKAIGNRIYGCDDCLAVCPWNKFAVAATEAKLQARDDLKSPALADLLQLDDAAFRSLFTGSPVKRIGRDRFMRNVVIAAGNSADRTLAAPVTALLKDASPLVRGAAVWALSELLPRDEITRLSQEHLLEADQSVRAEWHAALTPEPEGKAL